MTTEQELDQIERSLDTIIVVPSEQQLHFLYGHNLLMDMENNFAFWPQEQCLVLYRVVCGACRARQLGKETMERRAYELLIRLYESYGGRHPIEGYDTGDEL